MKQLLSIAFLFLSLVSSGQTPIIIDLADMPDVNDTFRVSMAGPVLNDFNTTGADHSWDFSNLVPLSQQVDTFISVGSTNVAFSFLYFSSSSYATSFPVPDSMPIPVDEMFSFYKESNSNYSLNGFGILVSGAPIPFKFNSDEIIYKFPLTFNTIDSTSVTYGNGASGYYYGQNRKRINYVDGWGNIMTPFDTLAAIRVRSELFQTDTIYADSNGTTFNRPKQIEYKWMVDNGGIPFLQATAQVIGGLEQITEVRYRDKYRNLVEPNSIHEMVDPGKFNFFPNPAEDVLNLEFGNPDGNSKLEIIDLLGRKVVVEQITKLGGTSKIEIQNLEPGIYFLRFIDCTSFHTYQFIKSKKR